MEGQVAKCMLLKFATSRPTSKYICIKAKQQTSQTSFYHTTIYLRFGDFMLRIADPTTFALRFIVYLFQLLFDVLCFEGKFKMFF